MTKIVLRRISKISCGAGGGIRTHDLTITNRLRYQTAPHRLGSTKVSDCQRTTRVYRSRLSPMSESSRPQHESHTPGSHYQPGLGVVLLILVLFVAAATLMLRSTNPSGPGGTTTTTTTTLASTQPTIPKARVRVQVANGTNVTGLARSYTQHLTTLGWDALPEVNGPATTATIVYYRGGFS